METTLPKLNCQWWYNTQYNDKVKVNKTIK